MVDVVTFGEVMAMFVAAETGELDAVDRFGIALSGAEMNVSVGLARLGHQVRYLGAVGDDPFGLRARRTLAAEGISGLVVDPAAPTGFQLKNRVLTGDPTVVYFREGSAASRYRWSRAAAGVVESARHLHVTGIFPALSPDTRECTVRAMAAARRAGATVSFDPNLRPVLWPDTNEMISVLNELAANADCVLPGLSEGRILTGCDEPDGIAAFYLDRGASRVVVKLGAEGAVSYTRDGMCRAPGFPVHVVDTVGAGDGFAAGWISGLLDGVEETEALRRACAIGALATTSTGDMDGLPTRTRLRELIDRHPAGETDWRPSGKDRQPSGTDWQPSETDWRPSGKDRQPSETDWQSGEERPCNSK